MAKQPRYNLERPIAALGAVGILLLAGCGGPDLGSGSNSGTFGQGLQGNYSGAGGSGFNRNGTTSSTTRGRGTYPKIEASFELNDIQGNPFDYNDNDVMVTFQGSDNRSVRVPAFYDGGKTWRVRYTPEVSGRLSIAKVQNNGHDIQPDKLDRKEFDVNGTPQAGFVRHDGKDKSKFAFDNGNSYYPLGHNVAWGTDQPIEVKIAQVAEPPKDTKKDDKQDTKQDSKPKEATPAPTPNTRAADYAAIFDKMNKAGENWSRVWATNFDNKNLDWPKNKKAQIGQLDLDVAKRWDGIVEAAERDSIYFQMVLQHHGQYSTRVDPMWAENPWNSKNGGFMSNPDEFFSGTRAVALTKAKYRYMIARWGYSPNIMAWELFNEVENTDAVYHKHQDEVAAWHTAMTAFFRQQDPYKHLVTSSSGTDVAMLGRDLDFYQPHQYPANALATVSDLDLRKLDRPLFYGEIGPSDTGADPVNFLHTALWGSALSESGGAAQYWYWEKVEKDNLYDQFKSTADFVRQSGMLSKRGLLFTAAGVETTEKAPLVLSPGAGYGAAKQTEFTVLPSGLVEGLGSMPAYLQGTAHHEMFPSATFKTTYPSAGTFTVAIGQVSKNGAHVVVSVDGTQAAEKTFATADKDTAANATLEAKVPAGPHTVKIENTGADWATIKTMTLSPYAPSIGTVGKSGKTYAALWLYNRLADGTGKASAEVKGKVTVPGMQAGAYKVTWWDTAAGKPLNEATATADSTGLTVETPSISRDMAVFITRANDKTASKPSTSKKKKGL
jgi:hypothetical protein